MPNSRTADPDIGSDRTRQHSSRGENSSGGQIPEDLEEGMESLGLETKETVSPSHLEGQNSEEREEREHSSAAEESHQAKRTTVAGQNRSEDQVLLYGMGAGKVKEKF